MLKKIFPSKKTSTTGGDVEKVSRRMARIPGLGISGRYYESKNGHYLLIRQNSINREQGKFALTSKGQVVCVVDCECPHAGCVSNVGIFAVADSLPIDKLGSGSKLCVYSPDGELNLSRKFSAIIFSMGISPDGTHAVVQLSGSKLDSKDGGRLYLFNIPNSSMVSAFFPETGWAERYEFSVPGKILYLCYKNNRRYKYSFDGSFFDRGLYDRERVEDASATELVNIVREKLREAGEEELPELLSMINRAFEGDLSKYDDWRALAFRLKGEILETLGDAEQAVLAYKNALKINPKIGVKQKLKRLEIK